VKNNFFNKRGKLMMHSKTIDQFRVLGLIPSRSGSKGVPQKNVRLLCGKPLLQYTAEAALSARRLSRVILSTDDFNIAEVGRKCGLEVPFIRPAKLAQDHTPMFPVVKQALCWLLENNELFDAVCLLQPTNPLRRAEDIDNCIELLFESNADAVMSVLPVPQPYNPHWTFLKDNNNQLRLATGETEPIPCRQELPPAFHREGSVYVTRTEVVLHKNSLYGSHVVGYVMDENRSVNIDTLEDWVVAEKKVLQLNGKMVSQLNERTLNKAVA
jgi:CMP-N-acetylneuraminic acid synthetase